MLWITEPSFSHHRDIVARRRHTIGIIVAYVSCSASKETAVLVDKTVRINRSASAYKKRHESRKELSNVSGSNIQVQDNGTDTPASRADEEDKTSRRHTGTRYRCQWLAACGSERDGEETHEQSHPSAES